MFLNGKIMQTQGRLLIPGYPGEANAPSLGGKPEWWQLSGEGLPGNSKTPAVLAGLGCFLLCTLRSIKYRKYRKYRFRKK